MFNSTPGDRPVKIPKVRDISEQKNLMSRLLPLFLVATGLTATVVDQPVAQAYQPTQSEMIDEAAKRLYEDFQSKRLERIKSVTASPEFVEATKNWDTLPFKEKFKTLRRFVALWEGGYVFNPNDVGGETNWGLTKNTASGMLAKYEGLREETGLTKQTLSMKRLTLAQADKFYEYMLQDVKMDEMSMPLASAAFDTLTNFGKVGYNMILGNDYIETLPRFKLAMGSKLPDNVVVKDGKVYFASILDLNDESDPVKTAKLVQEIVNRRLWYRGFRVSQSESQREFLDGWRNRDKALLLFAKKYLPGGKLYQSYTLRIQVDQPAQTPFRPYSTADSSVNTNLGGVKVSTSDMDAEARIAQEEMKLQRERFQAVQSKLQFKPLIANPQVATQPAPVPPLLAVSSPTKPINSQIDQTNVVQPNPNLQVESPIEKKSQFTSKMEVKLPSGEKAEATVINFSDKSYINFQLGRGMGPGMDVGRTQCAAASAVMASKIFNQGSSAFNIDTIGGKPGEKLYSQQYGQSFQFSSGVNLIVRGGNIDNPANSYGVMQALLKFGIKSSKFESGQISTVQIKAELDKGKPIIMGFEKNRFSKGKFLDVFSHYVVIVGYTHDAQGKMLLVVHDPNNNAQLMKGHGLPADSGEASGKFAVYPVPTQDGKISEGFRNPLYIVLNGSASSKTQATK